ncbi:unnamed protein product [Cyprideis torosa]|uniref:Sugar phosphate exchanger 3 n=1 Tax=Cyprideis torosa TaxID=163714 RepID=A0A7R8W282_9CRUS|nr:unnamed protein product [Cyprideis torosa]CAG0879510.1 unnamed protein product [Cyprideis torosa]
MVRYRWSVLFLTFLCYTSYHLSRKPLSVVKNVLHQNCSQLVPPPGTPVDSYWCSYPPFDKEDGDKLLGQLDSAFLFAYAFGMFASGFIAERVDVRYFLSIGMIFSGIFTYLFGIAKSYQIHSFAYFFIVQLLCGLCQTSGWPGVVSCVGNWFGEARRGLIFGIWNSHTSIGNILGGLIAAAYVDRDWSLSFIVPGLIIALTGFLMFLFLVPRPRDVGLLSMDMETESRDAPSPILMSAHGESAIGFREALRIPGVIEYSLGLFFAKLVSYTFLYWLPRYIKVRTVFSNEESANLSTLFDVGGILGGIAAGYLSDRYRLPAITCGGMLVSAIPMLFLYDTYGSSDMTTNIALLMCVGFLVNGPYALITTAVSAMLGQHKSIHGKSRALATVSAIIDGTGSIGAAIGPLLAAYISATGWNNVFYMLMVSDILALLA